MLVKISIKEFFQTKFWGLEANVWKYVTEFKSFGRPIYAGNALCRVRYTGAGPCVLTIRTTSFPVTPITESKKATISQIDLSKFKEGLFSIILLCIAFLLFFFFL